MLIGQLDLPLHRQQVSSIRIRKCDMTQLCKTQFFNLMLVAEAQLMYCLTVYMKKWYSNLKRKNDYRFSQPALQNLTILLILRWYLLSPFHSRFKVQKYNSNVNTIYCRIFVTLKSSKMWQVKCRDLVVADTYGRLTKKINVFHNEIYSGINDFYCVPLLRN